MGPLKKHTQKPIWTFGKSFQVPKDGISCCFLYVFCCSTKACLGGVFFHRGDRCFTSSTRWGNASASWGERCRLLRSFFFLLEGKPCDVRQWWTNFTSWNDRYIFLLTQLPKFLSLSGFPSGVGFCPSAACWCWVIVENWRLMYCRRFCKGEGVLL